MKHIFPLSYEVKRHLFWSILALSSMSIYIVSNLLFGQSLLLYFFVLIFVFLSIIKRPESGIYTILLCTMWFERHFTLSSLEISGHIYKIYPLDFVILFLFLVVIFRLIEKRIKWKMQILDWLILAFGAVCSIGLAIAVLQKLNLSTAIGAYKNYFLYAIIYFLFSALLKTKKDWKRLMKWLTVGGVGVFFFLFYGLIAGHGLWSEFTPLSTAGERLIAGTHIFYLVIFLFWLLSILLWQNCTRIKDFFNWRSILIYIGISLIGVALVVSLVRHLWIAVVGVLIFWLLFLPTLRLRIKYASMLLAIIIISAGMTFAYFSAGKLLHISNKQDLQTEQPKIVIIEQQTAEEYSDSDADKVVEGAAEESDEVILVSFDETANVLSDRSSIQNVKDGNDESVNWRIDVWKAGYNEWVSHPYLGLGLGYEIYGLSNNWPFHVSLKEIHNDYLAILYQLGILGFSTVIIWFSYLFVRFFKYRKQLDISDNFSRLFKYLHSFNKVDSFEFQLFFTFWSVILVFMVGFLISIYWDINLFVIWWWLSLAAIRFVWYKKLG